MGPATKLKVQLDANYLMKALLLRDLEANPVGRAMKGLDDLVKKK